VHTTRDSSNNLVKEVIIDKVEMRYERHNKVWGWHRYIPLTERRINTFKAKKDDDDEVDDPYNDDDTLLIQTEEPTFIPPLTSTPMPSSVIDELRGKYSAFRIRHTDEYLEDKAKTLQKSERRMQTMERGMKTPMAELRERRKQLAQEEEMKRELSDEVLSKIGMAMAEKMPNSVVKQRLKRPVSDQWLKMQAPEAVV
jgi:large subunit ribosomal protein L24